MPVQSRRAVVMIALSAGACVALVLGLAVLVQYVIHTRGLAL